MDRSHQRSFVFQNWREQLLQNALSFLIQSKSVISSKPGDSLQLASSCEADQKRLQGAQSLRNNQNTVQNVRMSLFFDVFRIKHQGERNAVAQWYVLPTMASCRMQNSAILCSSTWLCFRVSTVWYVADRHTTFSEKRCSNPSTMTMKNVVWIPHTLLFC